MSDLVERVARAIDGADVGYSISLTRLVDGVSTYTAICNGETREFEEHYEASEWVSQFKLEAKAKAAIAAMQADAAPDALAVINRIAEVSSAFACQAGVGGMETAGSIISFLATNPQRIPDFMAGGSVIDWPIGWHTAGCLSWHGMDGKIHWPGEGNIQ